MPDCRSTRVAEPAFGGTQRHTVVVPREAT